MPPEPSNDSRRMLPTAVPPRVMRGAKLSPKTRNAKLLRLTERSAHSDGWLALGLCRRDRRRRLQALCDPQRPLFQAQVLAVQHRDAGLVLRHVVVVPELVEQMLH